MAERKPDDEQQQLKLNEIFEIPHMKVDVVDQALSSLAKAQPEMEVYRNYFYLLAHLEFEETDAARHWEEFKAYHASFEKDLGYSIDTRITTLSYFINENKQLNNPKIIEMKVFQRTQDKVYLKRGGQICFVTPSTPQCDLRAGRMVGSHPNCGIFADHYSIYSHIAQQYSWALKEMDRYKGHFPPKGTDDDDG